MRKNFQDVNYIFDWFDNCYLFAEREFWKYEDASGFYRILGNTFGYDLGTTYRTGRSS